MRIEYDEQGNPKVIRTDKIDQADETKKNPRKFYDIPYLQKDYLDTFGADEEVWIEEKIDGSNVSCEIDEQGNFRCYGRRFELGSWYSNMGAYEKLLELEGIIRAVLPSNLQLYFEYLVRHHVKYNKDKENKLYLIGIKDKTTGKYFLPSGVYSIARMIGVETPTCFYHGMFRSWDIAKELVGKSEFGAKIGEGVIVKARDNKYGIKMVKIVAQEFRERMLVDESEKAAKMQAELDKRDKAAEIVTEARIRKQLYVLRDEGIISSVENMTKEDKINAIKNIGRKMYDDCIKEEPDFVVEFGKDFGKYSFMLSKKFIDSL